MSFDRGAVEDRIRELYDKHGRVTPDLVIEDAKDKKSPLHQCFEWDVQAAALEAWRETARRLIRSVKVVRTFEDVKFTGKGRPIPEFVRDPKAPSSDQGYSRAAELRSERDLAMSALMYEIDRADAAINRARNVAEALGLEEDIRLVASAIATVRKKAKGAA
jgi:hypothetical protein